MSPRILFLIQLVLGYVAWLLCFGAYVLPKLKSIGHVETQRAIVTQHSFRFFGLVLILPGVVGPNLPASFAEFAGYGDPATAVLAFLALLTVGIPRSSGCASSPSISLGAADLILDYYHAIQADLPALAGQLGAAYAIPIIYAPVLMITHFVALYLLVRHQLKAAQPLAA